MSKELKSERIAKEIVDELKKTRNITKFLYEYSYWTYWFSRRNSYNRACLTYAVNQEMENTEIIFKGEKNVKS